jgi:hypothetical protein
MYVFKYSISQIISILIMEVLDMLFSDRHTTLEAFLCLPAPCSSRLATLLKQTIVCWESDSVVDNFIHKHANQDNSSQSEVVIHCVDMLVIKSTPNVLAYGYRKLTMKSTTSCARSENFFPNSHVSYISTPVVLLDRRFGRNCWQ